MEFSIWRSCERFNILPPGVKQSWDDMDWWTQECLIQYNLGRMKEERDAIQRSDIPY